MEPAPCNVNHEPRTMIIEAFIPPPDRPRTELRLDAITLGDLRFFYDKAVRDKAESFDWRHEDTDYNFSTEEMGRLFKELNAIS